MNISSNCAHVDWDEIRFYPMVYIGSGGWELIAGDVGFCA